MFAKRLSFLVACLLLAAPVGVSFGQPLPPATTPWSRTLLRATSATNSYTILNLISTNQTEVTNWLTLVTAGSVSPVSLTVAVTNAWKLDATNAATAVTNSLSFIALAGSGILKSNASIAVTAPNLYVWNSNGLSLWIITATSTNYIGGTPP